MNISFSRRLTLVFAGLLCGFGLLVDLVGRHVMNTQERDTLQRLSHGLARHIVEHWPAVAHSAGGDAERRALDEVLGMLMVVNPAIEVYVLDAQGRVRAYLGDPLAVRQAQVDLAPVRAFLADAALPLLGTDPKRPGGGKIFSAAMFPAQPGDAVPPGYLYVVLEGEAHEQVAGHIGQQRIWQGMGLLLGVALLLTLLLGAGMFHRLTRPLRQLAIRMQAFGPGANPANAGILPEGDEVQAIAHSFDLMAARIDEQLRAEARQQATHRDAMANVAHDLRTPLTALHGHLEALHGLPLMQASADGRRHLDVALAQSNKVRRLTQQLFELARLQSGDQLVHVERFRLDELVADAVQKFSFNTDAPVVALAGSAPGPVELDGDLQLIERALTNLIDNALRHAPSDRPVRVSLELEAGQVSLVVEDHGPGLPAELKQRLACGGALRDPPMVRPGGGFGGLGLAIAQRIASLHGGSLSLRTSGANGTTLCLALPLTAV